VVVVLGWLVGELEGKYAKGSVTGNKGDFVFLSKFCYDTVPKSIESAAGSFQYKLNTRQASTWFLIYDDEKSYWPHVYRSQLTCEEKKSAMFAGYLMENHTAGTIGFRDVQGPHFWYMVACNCDEDVQADYEFTFLNYGNNIWTKQFSADEIGLEALYLSYFIFYVIGLAVHIFVVLTLLRTSSYHPVVKLLTISITLSFLSVLFLFIHYAIYQNNGVGAVGLKGMGDLLDIASQVTFIFVLELLAQGWAISKSGIDDKRTLLIGLGILSISYLVMFVWWNAGVDPADTLYIYMSAPGIITVVIRGLAMFWFIWLLRGTYLDENLPSKQQFYLWFGIGYVAWFMALPFIVGIAAGSPDWERLKTVTILYVTSTALGQAGLGYLLWPSRAYEYFQISARKDLADSIPYENI